MLSIPAGDFDEDEETEGLAAAIETGELVYDDETEILTNTKNAERVRIMADGTFQLPKVQRCHLSPLVRREELYELRLFPPAHDTKVKPAKVTTLPSKAPIFHLTLKQNTEVV